MRRQKHNTITGIDIGTHTIKVVVAEINNDATIRVIGVGTAPTQGVRNGYVTDLAEAVASVSKALDAVVKSVRFRPTHAYLSIGGISLSGVTSQGIAYIRHSDAVITEADFAHAMQDASEKMEEALLNKKIIHDIPLGTKIDNEPTLSNPVGMRGSKLENTVMLVHALESHIDDFVSAVEDTGVEVLDVTAAPLAASFATVSTPQRMQGCVLLDIGAESTDIVVYENNTPRAIAVLPVGSNDITNALALGLKISPQDAEQLKKGAVVGADYDQAAVDKLIDKHTVKLLTEVKSFLKNLDGNIMLPAGVLITGGGTRIKNIEALTKDVLKLPSKIVTALDKKIREKPEFSVAHGLCIWGANNDESHSNFSSIKAFFQKVAQWFKQFLP